jgi:hypothetical protein
LSEQRVGHVVPLCAKHQARLKGPHALLVDAPVVADRSPPDASSKKVMMELVSPCSTTYAMSTTSILQSGPRR